MTAASSPRSSAPAVFFTRYSVRAGGRSLTVDAPHLASEPLLAVCAQVRVGTDPAEVRSLPG